MWSNDSSEKPGELIASIWSEFNRTVIFDTTQNSWHGLPKTLTCPKNESRKGLAAYFLCNAPANVDRRGKALFAPTKEQKNDNKVLELIKKRADTQSAASVYEK